jgi:hypothetical protein
MAPYSNIISKPFSTGYVASREQEVTAATVIGIAIAITGNVLISLALNLQKLAHKRVDVDKQARAEERQPTTRQNGVRGGNGEAAGRGGEYLTEDSEDGEGPYTEEQPEARALVHSPVTRSTSVPILETQPLLSQDINEFPRSYGAGSASSNPPLKPNRTPTLRFASQSCFPRSRDSAEAPHTLLPVDAILEESASSRAVKGDLKAEENGSESDYLKSKLWWVYSYHLLCIHTICPQVVGVRPDEHR